MKKLFERSLFLLLTAAVLAASGLRLDYTPASAYDVLSGTGADGRPQVTGTSMLVDQYGTQNYIAPNGELAAVPLYKLVGDSFTGTTIDPGLWTTTLAGSGVSAISGGQLVLSTGSGVANGSAMVDSAHVARFSGLAPNKLRATLQLPDGGTVNNVREWGVSTATDGAFFRQDGGILRCVTRKNSVDTVVASSGTFNGQYGLSFSGGTTSHFYEIIYQPRQVVWLADNKIIYRLAATGAPWSNTLHLPIHFANYNTNGSTTNVAMDVRLGTIARFGIPQTQVDGYFQQGLTAGVQLKYGPGNVWAINVSGAANGAIVTIYDGTSTAGRIIDSTGAMGPQTIPLTLPEYGEAFNNGLFLTITGAAANAKVTFD